MDWPELLAMGSIGGGVTRSAESHGLVTGPNVSQLAARGGSSNLAALSSVAAGVNHNPNSLFMVNSLQSTPARTDLFRHLPNFTNRNVSGMIRSNYGSGSGTSMIGGLHGNFGTDSAPPALDLSEFPSLTSRNSDSSQPNPMAGRQPYVGMVKQPATEAPEFTMSNEDFPALPGAHSNSSNKGDIFSNEKKPGSSVGDSEFTLRTSEKSQSVQKGIQTTRDGKVTNIPSTMITDQFGMAGLLTFIRTVETDNDLVNLALGSDLNALGMNPNTPDKLYPNFGGPWAETPCRPQDIDYHVPQEYLIYQKIRQKLAPIAFKRYADDLLFYLFYSNVGDRLQILAANELYNREWRYHKDEKIWITKLADVPPIEKTQSYEMGTYHYFDSLTWRKLPKEFKVEYEKLEDCPATNGTVTPTSSGL